MSTINPHKPTRAISTGSPWGAVAPRAQVGNEEFKLVPDSVSLNPSRGGLESAPASGPSLSGSSNLANISQQTAVLATAAAAPGPLMLLLLGGEKSTKENQARKLADSLGLVHLNMGELIKEEVASGSELGSNLQQALTSGDRSPATLLYELVAERVREQECQEKGFILDAYPEDFKHHKAEDLLAELQGLRLIQLASAGGNCPDCIPMIEAAREKGAYYEVDDEEDHQDTADVLEALVDNFQSAPVRFMAV
jgi:hypothetical protein